MSRPKPKILLEKTDPKTYKSEQILEAEATWCVLYNSYPFNLRTVNSITNSPGPKYKKTSFTNPGHAHNLARRLNKKFETTLFTVVKIPK